MALTWRSDNDISQTASISGSAAGRSKCDSVKYASFARIADCACAPGIMMGQSVSTSLHVIYYCSTANKKYACSQSAVIRALTDTLAVMACLMEILIVFHPRDIGTYKMNSCHPPGHEQMRGTL